MSVQPLNEPPAVAGERLCQRCGLCCDGVLFGTVRLEREEAGELLCSEGIRLRSEGGSVAFDQPCPAHRHGLCAVYEVRPKQCRAFECGLLRAYQSGEIQTVAALARVASVQRLAEQVCGLLRDLGEINESWPLSRRCQRYLVMTDLDALPLRLRDCRSQLIAAVHELAQALKRDFYDGQTR